AQEHGWGGQVPAGQVTNQVIVSNILPSQEELPSTGPFASAAALAKNGYDTSMPAFARDKAGKPFATCNNTRLAVEGLGLLCRYAVFHGRMLVSGVALQRYAGELADAAVHTIRVAIEQHFGFDPTAQNVRDACEQLCVGRPFDPVVDYLNECQWDGRP